MRHQASVSIFSTVVVAAAVLGACNASPSDDAAAARELDGCLECRQLLVECASQVQSDSDFVVCRDEFQACQSAQAIRPGHCSNPSDEEACGLCRAERVECVGTGDASCDPGFEVCKSVLMSRGDVADMCSPDAEPSSEILCGVCQKDFVTCVSDASGANKGVCASKLDLCMKSNELDRDECRAPRGDDACVLCEDRHAECQASGLTTCDADFQACSDTVAPGCALDGGEGGAGGEGGSTGGGGEGGSGGGSSGGSGGGGPEMCAHDVCMEGVALEPECNACATDVCTLDSYCCDVEWDVYCTDTAYVLCGC